jgi:protein O-mannosyl-transferase
MAVAAVAALLIFLAFTFLAKAPRARLNVLQIASLIIFTAVVARFGISGGSSSSANYMEPSTTNRIRWELLLAPILSAGLYASTLSSYFINDDYHFLYMFRSSPFEALTDVIKQGLGGFSFRPAGFITLIVDHGIWGHQPFGYHFTNLLLHLSCVLGIYFMCRNLELQRETSAVSALIFAILPIHPEAVVWIASRFDLMATSLTIWVVVIYLKFRRTGRRELYFLALFLTIIATLSKENAFILPLLLLSLEYFAMPKREIRSAILPLLGFMLFTVATFAYRWIALGGIGGYLEHDGDHSVYTFGFKSIEGLFLRAPSQMLLGFNWYQPAVTRAVVISSLAAALLIVLAFFSQPSQSDKRIIRFSLVWMILGYLPAHFLTMISPGLTNSRILYLSSAGLAVIIAILLSGIAQVGVREVLKLALIVLFSLGLSHNLTAWRRVGHLSQEFGTALRRLVPDPPTNTEFVFRELPRSIEGVFYSGQLYEIINLTYNRADLRGIREEDLPGGSNPGTDLVIKVKWVGGTNGIMELVRD